MYTLLCQNSISIDKVDPLELLTPVRFIRDAQKPVRANLGVKTSKV